jgi:hypothetical protein
MAWSGHSTSHRHTLNTFGNCGACPRRGVATRLGTGWRPLATLPRVLGLNAWPSGRWRFISPLAKEGLHGIAVR